MSNVAINKMKNSVFFRALLLGTLILILQFPILAIEGLIGERSNTRADAEADISQTWGGSQVITGPVMGVPYRVRWVDEKNREREKTEMAYFLPRDISVVGNISSEKRYRGIFEVPVYTTALHVSGTFTPPDFSGLNIAAEDILWDGAVLSVQIDSPRSIREKVQLSWGGKAYEFEPGGVLGSQREAGIHVRPVGLQSMSGETHFEFALALNGSNMLAFVPTGDETNVELSSAWPDPGFVGEYLPVSREVSEQGFHAKWKVLSLGRGFPQRWTSQNDYIDSIGGANFGISFLSPVDTYRMNERLIKYESLIVFLTFLTFYLFEIFNRLLIHPVQYLLVGAGLCLFYLLTLSLSEHLGFGTAYAAAAAFVTALICLYSSCVLQSGRRSIVLGVLLSSLYAYFYVLLQEQDYALLLGSLGLALILGTIMFITRNIDWYRIGEDNGHPQLEPSAS
jgi:inner membrane protein